MSKPTMDDLLQNYTLDELTHLNNMVAKALDERVHSLKEFATHSGSKVVDDPINKLDKQEFAIKSIKNRLGKLEKLRRHDLEVFFEFTRLSRNIVKTEAVAKGITSELIQKVGTSINNPKDEFNQFIGKDIALRRLLGEEIPEIYYKEEEG